MDKSFSESEFSKRLDALETKLENMERAIVRFIELKSVFHVSDALTFRNFSKVRKDRQTGPNDLRVQLSEAVTGLIGFKELLTCDSRFLRCLWAILFVLGVGATAFFIFRTVDIFLTEPTATAVKLVSNKSYEYPPLLLCPDGWLDAEKAAKYNISKNAMLYSLGYVDFFNIFEVSDTVSARREFLEFFDRHNFVSLPEYYKTIAVDLQEEESVTQLRDQPLSSYLCKGCMEKKPVDHVCMNGGMCFMVRLKPDTVGAALGLSMSFNSRRIILKLADKTRGLMHVSPDWELYFSSNLDLLTSVSSYLIIRANDYSVVKLNAQRFFTLDKVDAPCLRDDRLPHPDYSTESCMAQCQNELYKEKIQCLLLPLSSGNAQQPEDYCNTLDKIPFYNLTVMDYVQSNETNEIESKFGDCIDRCPYRCERIMYQATLESATSMLDYDPENVTGSAIATGMSLVAIDILHSASFQGGISTLNEMPAYTFVDLISSIGGTLGLFVGATVMTFVQVFLFLVKYAFVKMGVFGMK